MSKRPIEDGASNGVPLHNGERQEPAQDGADDVQFEDEYEDEFESEDEIMEAGVDGRPDAEREAEEAENAMDVDNQTFMVGRNKLSKDEVLEPDETAYEMLHRLEPPWPCLSFDIIRDHLGEGRARRKYPATIYSVAGTQAAQGHEKENEILVMKMSKLSRTSKEAEDSESDDEDDSDDDLDADPVLETKHIKLGTVTNRIRAYQTPVSESDPSRPFATTLTAAMTESGSVFIHDITPHLTSFDTPGTTITPQQDSPIHTITSHKRHEGYALDWRRPIPNATGSHAPSLLTGDTTGAIYHTTSDPSGAFTTSKQPYTGHNSSVEELQWSPSEPTVFASASSDSTIRIWDTRARRPSPAITVKASTTDINVLSWSPLTSYLLASGDDSGRFAVWDLRAWQRAPKQTSHSPIADFNFHKEQITSVEWHPSDDSIVAVCAGDDTLSLWDLAVELDDEESRDTAGVADVPPQLLFVHYMEGVKEAHWVGQQEGVVMATGASGLGVFRTISV